MNNKPATQAGVIAVFLQFAIQLTFLYIGTDAFRMNEYLSYILSGLSLITYLLILAFLLSVLSFFKEKESILIAFGVFMFFSLLFQVLNMTVSKWTTNLITFYTAESVVHFLLVVYVAVMSFMVKHPVIRKGFALYAILLLVASITALGLPVLLGLLGVGIQAYRYINLISILPLIAAIIIFNRTAEGIKTVDFTSDKPLFKNDPF